MSVDPGIPLGKEIPQNQESSGLFAAQGILLQQVTSLILHMQSPPLDTEVIPVYNSLVASISLLAAQIRASIFGQVSISCFPT